MNGVVVLTIVVITLPTLLAEAVPHEGCSRQQEHLVKVHQVALAPHVPKGGSTVEISLKCTASKSTNNEMCLAYTCVVIKRSIESLGFILGYK